MINIGIFSSSHKVRTDMARILLLLAAFPIAAHSGFERNGWGTRAIGLANSYVAIADDPWAVCYNPAGLAWVSSFRGAAFFSPAQFGMNELRKVSVGAAMPFAFCTAGIVIEHFGYNLYNETNAALAFGAKVNEWVSLGATTHLHRLAIERYGSSSQFILDAGGIAAVTEDIRAGWCWTNITQASIGIQPEQLPQIFSMGVCYEITGNSRLTAELEKDIRFPIIKKFGYEQQLLDMLSLQLGISDNPDKFSCGFGIRANGFEFSYAGCSHPQLGWTHQVELSVTISP